MTFNSIYFAVFFAVVFGLAATLRRRVMARNVMLLVASYFFYGWWDWRFLSLLAISTVVDFACGRLLDDGWEDGAAAPPRTRRDRMVLTTSMCLNLGFLGSFKYFNFFVESAAGLLGSMGLQPNTLTLRIILPVGISFYTFQSMSYVIDVYRRELRPVRSLLDFALYVAFFPQLVAGPIERATSLLPQLQRPSAMTLERIYSGFWLVGWGLFKKVVLADNAALLVDAVFSEANPLGGNVLLAVYAFAIQIYCDFSGYTDMARGVARMMGFELMRNFDLPYLAVNPSDFWRRWHISLSTWLRDYLYIPLGGNRKGPKRTYVNLMLTMALGGLWHGAAWNFVLWGVYHGALLCVHRAAKPWLDRTIRPRTKKQEQWWLAARVVAFFHLACFGWLLFRVKSMEQAWTMLAALGQGLETDDPVTGTMRHALIVTAVVLAIVELAVFITKDDELVFRLPAPVRAGVYAAIMLAFVIFGEYGGEAFIYFQF